MNREALIAELRSSICRIESAPHDAFGRESAPRSGKARNEAADEAFAICPAIEERRPVGKTGKTQAGAHLPDVSDDKGEDEAERAFSKLIAVLNAGDKSESALRARLEKDGYSHDAADTAIARAKAYGFVDDMRYADLLIRSRVSQGRGSVRIERELRDNDIDPASVRGWPLDYHAGPDDEFERALDLLRRKPPKSKNPRDSAFRKLMGKGYPTSVASSAARTWWDEAHR